VKAVLSAVVVWAGTVLFASAPARTPQEAPARAAAPADGQAIFAAQCAFCHGRDATGGASGPDLTDSALVEKDVSGDLIEPVVRSGRPEKGMPPFSLAEPDLKAVVAYVHERKNAVQTEGAKPTPNPAKVTVTLPSGQTVTGSLAHHDEFTIALRDESGWYRSWPTANVKYTIDDPLKAHADQLPKYTDDDIHNLVAYLQTLK